MLNFSSISLANTRVRYALFALAYLIAVALYWPSFSGLPVWDDVTSLFFDPVMKPSFPYSDIWKNFTWPLSVTVQKALLGVAGKKYWIYHAINFSVHAFNSWLVYRLLRLLRIGRNMSFVGFLMFLIHPASVITVAWIIQLKTLLCFTFALAALHLFVRGKNKKYYILSIFFFLLSVLSKSSSLPFPLVLVFFMGHAWKSKRLLLILPFVFISAAGYYRLTHSQVAADAMENASEVTSKVVIEEPAPTTVPVPEVKPKDDKKPETVTQEKKPQPEPEIKIEPEPEIKPGPETKMVLKKEEEPKFLAQSRLMIKTLYYYFWQAFVPVDNAPVKGLNPFPPSYQDYLHLMFLLVLSLSVWRINLLPALIAAHIFLVPYLGIIPAPYMNVTWVSDQHLYLALPCFILFLAGLAERLKTKWTIPVFAVLLVFFGWKTHEASGFYKNNFAFYEASIHSNYNNIPLVYNLSVLYIMDGRKDEARSLMKTIIDVSREEPYLKDNRYYPYLIDLYSRLRKK
jgi:hypothetical protein